MNRQRKREGERDVKRERWGKRHGGGKEMRRRENERAKQTEGERAVKRERERGVLKMRLTESLQWRLMAMSESESLCSGRLHVHACS